MRYTTADIRQFLTEAFSDEELTMLCFDYFRDVCNDFASGMGKKEKIQRLIEYCQRHEIIPNLFAAIQKARPEQEVIQMMQQFGGELRQAASAELGAEGRDRRCADLAENIREALDLIKQYEEQRRLSDDPKAKQRAERQVVDLREQLAGYEAEYRELGCE